MERLSIAVLAILVLSGCELLRSEVAPKVAKAVVAYCDEPQDARAVVRASVNSALEADGHSVLVRCNGDE